MANRTAEIAASFLGEVFVASDAAHARFASSELLRSDAHAGFLAPENAAHVLNLVIVDGDCFAIHRHFFTHHGDRGCVVVDIWRVAEERLVEHWAVVQPVPETMLHGNTMWCGQGNDFADARVLAEALPAPRGGWPDQDADAAATVAAIDAYRAALDHDVRGAIERWLAPDYRQHSPHIADGAEAAIAYFLPRVGKPRSKATFTRVLAEGDLALYHRHVVRPDGPPEGRLQVDIFRVTNGKICEHWDVMHVAPTPP